jgi:hypothetical protein
MRLNGRLIALMIGEHLKILHHFSGGGFMAVKNTSILALQHQLYSTICQVKVLSRAFDAICEDEVDEDEVNGLTEGFSDVVDRLEDISRKLDDFKEPVDLNVVAKIAHLRS